MLIQFDYDEGRDNHLRDRIDNVARSLRKSLKRGADHILFLRGELDFNRHIRHNLHHWGPLRSGRVTLAGLYNPGVRELACDVRNNARVVAPRSSVFGSPVFLVSREVVDRFVRYWMTVEGGRDSGLSRLAGKLSNPILYHAPSLVQALGTSDEDEKRPHKAVDFDPGWRA